MDACSRNHDLIYFLLPAQTFLNLIFIFCFQSEDLSGLDFVSLDELQNFHANALSKIRLTKVIIYYVTMIMSLFNLCYLLALTASSPYLSHEKNTKVSCNCVQLKTSLCSFSTDSFQIYPMRGFLCNNNK